MAHPYDLEVACTYVFEGKTNSGQLTYLIFEANKRRLQVNK